MTEQRALHTLHVAPKRELVRGSFEFAGGKVVDFEFALAEANSFSTSLRQAAAVWAEAYERRDGNKDKLWRALHDLGARCFGRLFNVAAKTVEKCLSDAAPGAEMRVWQHDTGLSMPWGLLCTAPDAEVAKQQPLVPSLWSAKYNLRTHLQHGMAHYTQKDDWRFEAVVCKKTYAVDIECLPPESVPLGRTIMARSLNPGEQSTLEAPPNCFLYVHAHSRLDGRELKLVFEQAEDSDAESFLPIELVSQVTRLDSGAAVLAVLNGCNSARCYESMGPSLLSQSVNIEVACIATEFPLHHRFATDFGLELIDLCVQQGESSYAAMRALRLKHYPLSIIYSHYCKNDLAAGTPVPVFEGCDVDTYRASIRYSNFSYPQGAAPQ